MRNAQNGKVLLLRKPDQLEWYSVKVSVTVSKVKNNNIEYI